MIAKPGTLWNEDQCWNVVDEINWGNGKQEDRPYDAKGRAFRQTYPNYNDYMREFSRHMRRKLIKVLDEYSQNHGRFIRIHNDSGWDLTAHIVGLGKEFFYNVMRNPEIAGRMSDDLNYIENFEYCFSPRSDEDDTVAQIQFKPKYIDERKASY